MNPRYIFFDILKGIAILVVILYHMGILPLGYLGVDVFLVISGYFTTATILKTYPTGTFNYFSFIKSRIIRLLPLVLIATIVSTIIGYFVMIPGDFKFFCEMAVGCSVLSGNIIQYITSRDYWDAINDFKPLMHLWYVGLIFQFYLLYPLIFICSAKCKNKENVIKKVLWTIFFISICFYVIPFWSEAVDTAVKFYLLPARLFEFIAGGLIMVQFNGKSRNQKNSNQPYALMAIGVLTLLIVINLPIDPSKFRLITVIALTVILIILKRDDSDLLENQKFSILAKLGAASYSLYITHQVVIAFYRYIINYNFSLIESILLFVAIIAIGLTTYQTLEKGLLEKAKTHGGYKTIMITSVATIIIISSTCGYIYYKHGVVRDVPEFDISISDNHNWELQEYNARITKLYDKSFQNDNRKKIFVFGDSYGRDWVNIMLEAGIDTSKYDLSYHEALEDSVSYARSHQADIIFAATNLKMEKYYQLLPLFMNKKFWRVGHKRFSYCMGPVYNHVFKNDDYFEQRIIEPNETKVINAEESKLYQPHYIDMMGHLRDKNGKIKVFTPDKKFISNDGMHLTQAGAKYFATLIDVKEILAQSK